MGRRPTFQHAGRPKLMPGQNIDAAVICTHHSLMQHHDWQSAESKSRKCPSCEIGIMAVLREEETFVIKEIDHCLYCGQKVRYADIEEMRRDDWANAYLALQGSCFRS